MYYFYENKKTITLVYILFYEIDEKQMSCYEQYII